jgi:multiple sugar transport system substrate-binding protein
MTLQTFTEPKDAQVKGLYAMKNVRHIVVTLVFVGLIAWLTGCSSQQGQGTSTAAGSAGKQIENAAPVTLKLLQYSANISDDEFQSLIADPVKAKYPNITMEIVRKTADMTLEQIFAAGDAPDMIFTSLIAGMQEFMELKVPYDLSDLAKKYNLDINRFDPPSIAGIRMYSTKNELFAIPMSVNFAATFYNKDIFDQFAAAYPKDGMTWDDAIELGKRVTRTVNGVQYFGLYPDTVVKVGQQLSLTTIDPKTNKAKLLTDEWKRVFDVVKQIYDIPGNNIKGNTTKLFENDRIIAMLVNAGARVGELETLESQGQGMNWDLTTVPYFKGTQPKGYEVAPHNLVIAATSKYKDEAFKVITLVTSDERQLAMSKQGRFTSLNDLKAKQEFGADLKTLKGKNLKPLLNYQAASTTPNSTYATLARDQINPAMNKVLDGKADINTALREAEEAADKAIAAEMGANH